MPFSDRYITTPNCAYYEALTRTEAKVIELDSDKAYGAELGETSGTELLHTCHNTYRREAKFTRSYGTHHQTQHPG